MVILSVEDISKTLKDAPLFEHVTFGMESGDRIGLVGPNGCGKSTFLKILGGRMDSDNGTIAKAKDLTLSILDQQPQFTTSQTVEEFLYDSDHPTCQLLNSYRNALHGHTEHSKGSTDNTLHRIMDEIERIHGWDVETRYNSFLGELSGPAPDQLMETLSGGMLKKVAIARTLAPNPDLVFLDEPTNHLDIQTISWLERYLVNSGMSVILVTHDRYLLDHVCNTIMEFDNSAVYSHPGSYKTFLERRGQRLSSQQAEQERLKTILRRELQWLSRGPKARTGKDSGRKSRIEDMQSSLTKEQDVMADFSSMHRRMGKKILELTEVGKEYDGRRVVEPFSHSFSRGERLGLIGPNGSGKTTLLEILSGRIEADFGMIDVGVNTVFGYYDQMDENLDTSKTVLEHISEMAEEITLGPGETVSAVRFLEMFGFPSSFHRMEIERLSGGERRRLHLIGILIKAPNFLLLDEPTNDLDIDTIRRLEEYLIDFSGCVMVVSHDRAFLDRVAQTLLVFDETGTITEFAGSYSDYEDSQRALAEQKVQESKSQTQSDKNRSWPVKREKKLGLTFKERHELESLLEKIDKLELSISALEESFVASDSDPETLEQRTREYGLKRTQLEEYMQRWEYLAEKDV